LINKNPSLAISNIYGSTIANILGSFSIGLWFSPTPLNGNENKSARIYSSLALGLSILIAVIATLETWNIKLGKGVVRGIGGGLIGVFGIYVIGIAYGIYRGVVVAPEDSDSDSDSDSDAGSDTSDEEEPSLQRQAEPSRCLSTQNALLTCPAPNTPLLPPSSAVRRPKPLSRHILSLIFSTLALSLSGYLLSSTTSNLASLLHLTQSSLGLTLLSVSTTLPEKLIAFKAGKKAQTGVLVANTVGSNVFLGTLVLGLVWVVEAKIGTGEGEGMWVDAWVGAVASLVLWGIVWKGVWKRWAGVCMGVGYVVYLVSVFARGNTDVLPDLS
jgi:Ca2+/Na+ antiporter